MGTFSRDVAGATRPLTYRHTPWSVTSVPVKSAVACGAACGDAGTHNVCAHRMSQSDDFVLITKTFGRETSPIPLYITLLRCVGREKQKLKA